MSLNRKSQLKRTPLNRGTYELKRTPLARTGPIKRTSTRQKMRAGFRKNDDPSVREAYCEANPNCEMTEFWVVTLGFEMPWSIRILDVHHLVGTSAGRRDIWSNLFRIDRGLHWYVELHPVEGRIICAHLKHAKGELDLASCDQLFGQSLVGWLGSDKVIGLTPAWLEPYRVSLLASLDDGK